MEEMQQQIVTWCMALNDYLKCEQCHGKLSPDIYLCEAGHLVCSSCLLKTTTNLCSLCKLPFTRTRNYLAENLSGKMDDILEKIGINDTDDNDDLESVCSESNPSWRMFPCWVGKCKYRGTPEDMRQHCRDNHRGLFETIDNKFPISRSWSFDYSFPRTLNRFFDVTDVGIFLLHIVIYDNGALRAYVFMYENVRTAKDHKYQLKVECAGENLSYSAEVDCARIPRNQLAKRGLFIPRAQNLQVKLQSILKFTVSVEITKNLKNPENPSNLSNVQKKIRRKNCRKSHKSQGNDQEAILSHVDSEKTAEPQQKAKPTPKSRKNNNNNTNSGENDQKTADSDAKNGNHKHVAQKHQDIHKNQSKVNNCLQTTEPSQRIPSGIPSLMTATPVSMFPGANVMQQQYGGHPGGNFYQGPNFGGFNPHVPPMTPGPSGHCYNNPPTASTFNHQPSAPVEDHFKTVQYPDLTPIRQGMNQERLDELQQKINEKERARLASEGHLARDPLAFRSGAKGKDKDKCCIS